MKILLTKTEIEALHAATGNIDPCMFTEEWPDSRKGKRLFDAWISGREKLAKALEPKIKTKETPLRRGF